MLEDTNKSNYRSTIYKVGGAVLGFIIVKALLFSAEDNFLWHIFLAAIFDSRLTMKELGEFLINWTIIKLAIGTYLGMFLGKLVGDGTIQEFIKTAKEEMNEEEIDEENTKEDK